MVTTTQTERETERDRFIWLFNNCQNRVAIPATVAPTADTKYTVVEEKVAQTDTRPLGENDVKVTVKWSTTTSNNELAHLAPIIDSPHYKLGIRFTRWRKKQPERKLVTLGHELGHARYQTHGPAFWDFVIEIWNAMLDHKPHLESWFDTAINWDIVRSTMLDDAYDNAPPDQKEDFMNRVSDALDYPTEWTTTLDWGRGLQEITADWPTENKKQIAGSRINFSREYSDKELYDCFEEIDSSGFFHAIPVVKGTLTETGAVTIHQNEIIAALCLRTKYDPYVPVVLEQNPPSETLGEAYRDNADHASQTTEEWKHTSTEANKSLGEHPSKD